MPWLLAALSAGAALPAAAQAAVPLDQAGYVRALPHVSEPSASGFYIRGGGDGHGIGLSQYGTLGYAQHGWTYQRILSHYYQGTALGSVTSSDIIRVLLKDGSAQFSGANQAGSKTLKPGTTYTVSVSSGKLKLSAPGTKSSTFSAPLTVSGSGPLALAGVGEYRGDLVFRPDGSGGAQTVNALDIDDYVRGVVSAEVPSSWPAQALRAQAVAARTYALTAGSAGSTFDVYSDTRSQMYEGIAAETSATNAAVSATRGKVVTYHGAPVVTYFSSSSGGHTESIQNVWLGSSAEPWLRGVSDPYDGASGNPNHRWSYNLSVGTASRKLSGDVKGSLVGIRVLKHGVSPRIVEASVVGTKGSTNVTGPALQQDFGLMSTYVAFSTVSMHGVFSASTSGSSGGGGASAGSSPAGSRSLVGRVYPTGRGVLVLAQKLGKHGWSTTRRVRTVNGGHYQAAISGPGRYRIKYGNVGGPALTIR
ncbi:MAG TPA: SpoIID/LytB domain-containing protein [Solirubrobacteraceae bacterium]|nr:SpoIID/LytB domain-containing protein [Solirubrobacteraceae bacterium]